MDRQLTFEILLYLNIFFTTFYAGIEAFFLLMKYIYVTDYDGLTLLNEVFLLLVLCCFEAARLHLGREDNLQKKISVVFRILVLTVPAQYLTVYFTFWQTKITQVDTILGIILLTAQWVQMLCAFISCLPNRHRICFNPFETDWEKLHWWQVAISNNNNMQFTPMELSWIARQVIHPPTAHHMSPKQQTFFEFNIITVGYQKIQSL